MESTKSKIATLSHKGSLYNVYNEIHKQEVNRTVILQFPFVAQKSQFSGGVVLDLPIIAHTKAVCYSVKICVDRVSGVNKVIFVFKNIYDSIFTVLQLENNNFELIGDFSLSDTCSSRHKPPFKNDIEFPGSEICTQVFSTFRTQSQSQQNSTIPVTGVSTEAVFILDGPTICVVFNDKIYLSNIIRCGHHTPHSASGGQKQDYICFTESRLPTHLRGCCLLWIGVSENHVIFLGSVSGSFRHNTKSKTPGDNDCVNCCTHMGNVTFDTEKSQRALVVFKIEISKPHHRQQQTQILDIGVEECPSNSFIPNIYSNIIVRAVIRNYKLTSHKPDGSGDAKIQAHNSDTYICTTLQQMVHFKNGHVQNCVSIPTACAAEIKHFETFSGQPYISIWSSDGKVILVDELSFQVYSM